eukprot:GEMP01008098.1.p1 GENE.GEMP01008098.1~~GEMP01008098.1.p1  ORF type:complete len:492 (+),score=98.00 GEMP01008098.1:253-1728(+)
MGVPGGSDAEGFNTLGTDGQGYIQTEESFLQAKFMECKVGDCRTRALLELLDYFSVEKKPTTPEWAMREITALVNESLQLQRRMLSPGACEEESAALVYDLFIRFITLPTVDSKGPARTLITTSLIESLLGSFRIDQQLYNERDYVKTIVHRIYRKFMSHRSFIRHSIRQELVETVESGIVPPGLAQLLEIYCCIISGFVLPLKAEHETFLRKALLPLHKVCNLAMFHPQISQCVRAFLDKQPLLADEILRSILRYWPVQAVDKQVLVLKELFEVLEFFDLEVLVLTSQDVPESVRLFFHRLASCVVSSSYHAAELAHLFCDSETYRRWLLFFPAIHDILLPAFRQAEKTHWHPDLQKAAEEYLGRAKSTINKVEPPPIENGPAQQDTSSSSSPAPVAPEAEAGDSSAKVEEAPSEVCDDSARVSEFDEKCSMLEDLARQRTANYAERDKIWQQLQEKYDIDHSFVARLDTPESNLTCSTSNPVVIDKVDN